MHNHNAYQKKALPLAGIRCHATGGSVPIKKGEDCAPALWYHLNKTQLSGVSCFALRRCSSSRATLTSRLISSLAVTPIASTCSRALSDERRWFSAAPSVWRLVISPRMAATINPAVLSSVRLTASMSSMTSWGMRIEICFDLSLMVFFATYILLITYCDSVYMKMNHKKHLTCDSVKLNLNHTLNIQVEKNGEARQCVNTNRASNHNDRISIEVAMRNHITAPQRFTFLFLAVVRANPQAQPHREQITAATEREARSFLAGRYVLLFAGRLPVQGGSHV